MNYTDEQLKKALAKMLPDKIYFDANYLVDNLAGIYSPSIIWKADCKYKEYLVLDTELLYLCWLVEDDFNSKQQDDYGKELYKLIPYGKMLFSATWQQRVIALAKAKGIEI